MTAVNFGTLVAGAVTVVGGQTWYCDGEKWYPLSALSSPFGVPYIAKTVCVGGETSVTFDNIPQNFSDLELVYHGRDSATGSSLVGLWCAFNGDNTAANYTSGDVAGVTAAAFAETQPSDTRGILAGVFPGVQSNANAIGGGRCLIPNYASSTFPKVAVGQSGTIHAATYSSYAIFGRWTGTAPITKMVLKGTTSFVAGSTFVLYGRGASNLTPAVYQSTTAPSAPFAGQLWWKSDEGTLKIYYGSAWVDASTLAGGDSSVCQGRLTLASGTPVTTTDQTSKTTIYWTPYKGNRISLYDGSIWTVFAFSEVSIALGTLTSGKNYDVFAYNNSGTLALEFGAAWASDTARTDALALQDGVYVKSGNTTRRYLGTFRTTSTTTTEDSAGGVTTQVGGKRFLWNYYNRVARRMLVIDTTTSWSQSGSSTWRQANSVAGNQVECVQGMVEDVMSATLHVAQICSGSGNAQSSIGVNSTSTPNAIAVAGYTSTIDTNVVTVNESPQLGYNKLCWLERSTSSATATWYGGGGGASGWQSGMTARVMA